MLYYVRSHHKESSDGLKLNRQEVQSWKTPVQAAEAFAVETYLERELNCVAFHFYYFWRNKVNSISSFENGDKRHVERANYDT